MLGAMFGYNTIICDTGSQLGIGEDAMSVSVGTSETVEEAMLQRVKGMSLRIFSKRCLRLLHTKDHVKSTCLIQDSHSFA